MADIVDQAQTATELFDTEAWKAYRDRRAATVDEHGDGVCRDCGDGIQPERLRANPHALRCVDCQMDHERRESHFDQLYGE